MHTVKNLLGLVVIGTCVYAAYGAIRCACFYARLAKGL